MNRVSYYEVVILIRLAGSPESFRPLVLRSGEREVEVEPLCGRERSGASRRNPERGRPAAESKELFFIVITNPRQRAKDLLLSLLIPYSCQPARAPSRLLLAGWVFLFDPQ